MGRKNRPRAKHSDEAPSRPSKYALKKRTARLAAKATQPAKDETPPTEESYIEATITNLQLKNRSLFLKTNDGVRLHMTLATWQEKFPAEKPSTGVILTCKVEHDVRGPHVTEIL